MRLQTRFSLSHAAVAVLTLAASMVLFQVAGRMLLQRQERNGQYRRLEDFAEAAREAVFSREDVGLVHAMRVMLKDPAVVYVAYANPDSGTRLTLPDRYAGQAWRGATAGQAAARAALLPDGTEAMVWSQPLEPHLKRSGWVELAFSAQDARRQVSDEMGTLDEVAGGILLASLLAGGLLAWALARRMVRPLQEISQGTALVRKGKLEQLLDIRRDDEIGDLARDFNSMVVQLKELDAMKRDFVAGVTHDFGAPLHALRITVNNLLSGAAGKVQQRQAEYLLMLSNNLATLSDFVNNLLSVARIEAGKAEPFFEAVDPAREVDALMKLYELQVSEKGLAWDLTARDRDLGIRADLTMFRQVVMNLISNAIKFTDQGRIDLSLAREGNQVVLTVRDTGMGIAAKYHDLIFDRFFRIRQKRGGPERKGSGLGLSIVKGLVELHGGSVAVASSLGHGAAFTVRWPKQPPSGRSKAAAP
jgi:signal transduction histidine kinase